MEEIIKNINEGIKAGIEKANNSSDIVCPFCQEDGFDLPGLKYHLMNYCERFDETIDLSRQGVGK